MLKASLNPTKLNTNDLPCPQGNKVRELKAAKAEKSVVDAQVKELLSLKQQLATAQGAQPDTAAADKKKAGKGGAKDAPKKEQKKPQKPAGDGPAALESEEVTRLTSAVAEQVSQ